MTLPQRDIFSRILLRTKSGVGTWWFGYLILSEYHEFEKNYMAAWREQAWREHMPEEKSIAIFLGDERLVIPRPEGNKDKTLLVNLRMFYRLLKIKRGLPELILPKMLARMDWVKVSSIFQVAIITPLNYVVARSRLEHCV